MSENRILTELPKKGSKNIDWKSTVGMNVELIYNDKLYVVKIVGYEGGNIPILKIEYNNNTESIRVGNFLGIKVGKLLNLKTRDFKFKIGQNFDNIIIIDREYRIRDKFHSDVIYKETQKWYKYKCNVCGWDEGWIEESNLKAGQRCACCYGKVVVEDINSIWATDRWMCGLGLSEQDAKTHTRCSNKRVAVTCPDCNKTKKLEISKLYNYKSICCTCGKSVNYPEKFMMSALEQLGIEYVFQLTKTTFGWCGKYKYDFYIPSLNTIIETHGIQHYKESNRGRSLKEEQENDKYKEELAIKNGINQYIVIDCRKSELEWIKNSILNSKLNQLYDLSKVDWKKCEEFALKNLVGEVCDYWNNKEDWETVKDLASFFKLSRDTIINYLKKGTELGWCNYDSKEQIRINGINSGKLNCKRVGMYDLNGNIIKEECSIRKLVEEVKREMGISLGASYISSVCKGRSEKYNGYIFKYIN